MLNGFFRGGPNRGRRYPTKLPDGTFPYRVELIESAMRADGSCFMDHDVHRALRQIADYSCRLNVEASNPEKKVGAGTDDIAIQAGEVVEAINRKTGARRRGSVFHMIVMDMKVVGIKTKHYCELVLIIAKIFVILLANEAVFSRKA